MSLSRSFFLLCLLSSCRARWTKIEEDNNLAVKENNNWGKIRDTNVADDGYTRRLGKIRAPEVSSVAVSGSKIRGDCVALSSITALTFEEGGVARRSRTPPVVSMSCVGNCEGGPRVTAAQCKRQGVDDGGSPQWECRGRFSPAIPPWGFGRVRVQYGGSRSPVPSTPSHSPAVVPTTVTKDAIPVIRPPTTLRSRRHRPRFGTCSSSSVVSSECVYPWPGTSLRHLPGGGCGGGPRDLLYRTRTGVGRAVTGG
eukprot:Hpha_TRINITY_DN11009_c0_g1::TRINITY_DN11009_c0_g1_i1::g.92628::m.92628